MRIELDRYKCLSEDVRRIISAPQCYHINIISVTCFAEKAYRKLLVLSQVLLALAIPLRNVQFTGGVVCPQLETNITILDLLQ